MDTTHATPNYMAIFYWLFALTVAEVAVTYLPIPHGVMAAVLITLAVVKASMVAMYFMHLKFENRTLAAIAVTPPVLLVMFLALTYPDTAWRVFTEWAAHRGG